MARQYLNTYPQRGLIIVLSDFLDDGDCLRPLQYLADFGHELLLVQMWGDEDRTPSDTGDVELVDAESGSQLKISLDANAREQYTAAFDAYVGSGEALGFAKRRAVRRDCPRAPALRKRCSGA